MEERELLERAAKAAGFEWRWFGADFCTLRDAEKAFYKPWNPLEDDGDALRLAVKLSLKLDLCFDGEPQYAAAGTDDADYCEYTPGAERFLWLSEASSTGDPAAATRRAIVLAAAEIGNAMSALPEPPKEETT